MLGFNEQVEKEERTKETERENKKRRRRTGDCVIESQKVFPEGQAQRGQILQRLKI